MEGSYQLSHFADVQPESDRGLRPCLRPHGKNVRGSLLSFLIFFVLPFFILFLFVSIFKKLYSSGFTDIIDIAV